jgi:DNA primase small subunit
MREVLPQTLEFIQKRFLEYYKSSFQESCIPNSFENREFGALLFKEKIMVRHKSFKQFEQLKVFLCDLIPSDVYYSSAYYEEPAASEMSEKHWLGADLVFDIDADHIATSCGKVHDQWVCGNCGFSGKGVTPEKCPSCGGQKIDAKTLICDVCLETTKRETIKLLDTLTNDFGFSNSEVRVFFSGNRGYHVHIENEAIQSLDQLARKEIVDYVVGIGLDESLHGVKETGRTFAGPSLADKGWNGRIARGTYDLFSTASASELESWGLPKKTIETIVKRRTEILESWKDRGPWGRVKGMGVTSWQKLISRSVELQSAKIDTVVTTDVHRLIRLNNTLHGKTGLKKTEVSAGLIEDFDPLKRAIAFEKGAVEVFVHESLGFRLGDSVFEAFRERKVEMPTAAALFLLCKGVAEVTM